ncbi:hypothetical protein CRG98_036236 [Punica granatum]|uniref:BHLH domain-containing protein n=1 Tax=Punica granatum TaxID=22663 RepID=A0A2I0IHJ1_PUNGR|nr:hypothetical protein CRG98_036236 [Punica granatum]
MFVRIAIRIVESYDFTIHEGVIDSDCRGYIAADTFSGCTATLSFDRGQGRTGSFSLSSHGQEMLGGHEPQLHPNYSFPKPFVSGQTTNDSNKAPKDADVDEENKKKKTRHIEIERQRRKEMNTLYASLRSLLPAQILKGKRAASDQLNVALDYINHIQRNIKKLEAERARLKKKGLDKMWYFLQPSSAVIDQMSYFLQFHSAAY